MTRHDQHTVTAAIVGPGINVPLKVKKANVTLDSTWAPYAQANFDAAVIDRATALKIDPRKEDMRVQFTMRQNFGLTADVDALSTEWGGQTLDALTLTLDGMTLDDLSALYFTGFDDDPEQPTERFFDLGLRSFKIDWRNDLMTLEAASDEATAQDYKLLTVAAERPQGIYVADTVNYALSKIGAALGYVHADFNKAVSSAYELWTPGLSVWDYINPIVTAQGARLYCDERRVWRLDRGIAQPAHTYDQIILGPEQNLTEASFGISLEDNYADAVVVRHEWTEAALFNENDERRQLVQSSAMHDQLVPVLHHAGIYNPVPGMRVDTTRYFPTIDAETVDRLEAERANQEETSHYGYAVAGSGNRVLFMERTGRPSHAEAAALLSRASLRGQRHEYEAVSDYTAHPGIAVVVALPDQGVTAGVAAAVTWSYPENTMALETRLIIGDEN